MDNNQSSYAKGLLLGAVVGGAVGALAALLFAPKSGRELRQDIADKGGDLYDKAQRYFTKEEQELAEFVNEGKLRAERMINDAREQASSLMTNAEQVLRDAKSRANSVKENVQSGAKHISDAAKAGAEAFRNELK